MTEHHLIIMRHAKSDRPPGCPDFQRPLAPRGIRAIAKIADWLRDHILFPDRIIASPALRARQTAELLLKELEMDTQNIVWEEKLYAADLTTLLQGIEAIDENSSCVLLIGHNPGLEQLLYYLSPDQPAENKDGKLLTTAAIAVLGYGSGGISTEHGRGTLLHLVRPKEL